MAKVTLQSIADRVGVSRMTVSNAFSRPDQLSTELRARILSEADQLGYTGPDPSARALARGRNGSVGLVVKDPLSVTLRDHVAVEFVGAVSDALADAGLALTTIVPDQHAGGSPISAVAMDAAIIYVCGDAQDHVRRLQARRMPLVAVDREAMPGASSIGIDDEGGAAAAAQHVVDLGHRRIALLTLDDPDRWSGDMTEPAPVAARMRGWRRVLGDAGIEPVVVGGRFMDDTDVHAAAVELLSGPPERRPTAVLCFSDAYASVLVRAALELGLHVPGDLSVVGFDDSPLAAAGPVPLTTVHQDVTAKAHAAVRLLLPRLADPDAEPESTVMPTELVVRASTAPAPGTDESSLRARSGQA